MNLSARNAPNEFRELCGETRRNGETLRGGVAHTECLHTELEERRMRLLQVKTASMDRHENPDDLGIVFSRATVNTVQQREEVSVREVVEIRLFHTRRFRKACAEIALE